MFICDCFLEDHFRMFCPGLALTTMEDFLSRARATLKSVTNTREMLQEGYYKVKGP